LGARKSIIDRSPANARSAASNNFELRCAKMRTMAATREELLAVVERSPAWVEAQDRENWLALFGDDALVEDPVGAPPARKATGALGRFWDTFIAPHHILFEIRRDHVIGRDVFRDAVIHTRIGPHVAIEVPASCSISSTMARMQQKKRLM